MTTTTIRPISPLTTTGVIKAKHPVREDFASWSTGSGCGYYYPTKGHAVKAFDTALKAYNLFEELGQADAAEKSRKEILERWPDSSAAKRLKDD